MGKQIYLTDNEQSLVATILSAYDQDGTFVGSEDEELFNSLKRKFNV